VKIREPTRNCAQRIISILVVVQPNLTLAVLVMGSALMVASTKVHRVPTFFPDVATVVDEID
jgi:hypothetical protein